jgi:hypothetical protein
MLAAYTHCTWKVNMPLVGTSNLIVRNLRVVRITEQASSSSNTPGLCSDVAQTGTLIF